jgi:hypothetical protein
VSRAGRAWMQRLPGALRGPVHELSLGPADRLAGGADLSIVVHARATDDNGRATYRPADATHAINVAGSRRSGRVFDGAFEGRTQIGLGVRARLPSGCSAWRAPVRDRAW